LLTLRFYVLEAKIHTSVQNKNIVLAFSFQTMKSVVFCWIPGHAGLPAAMEAALWKCGI
jgi:hypothetical protein